MPECAEVNIILNMPQVLKSCPHQYYTTWGVLQHFASWGIFGIGCIGTF